ncbi:hypothetical protein EVU96_17450 [Bacillus infantis]|uniref:hypothetical protein n=1 Tax=Bacillus infantis TaxID=324767 RepID=UPI00101D51CF|nr:hypothetical protein [Bacillus infantis]RYI27564.1 hypothetical protein EVU96_17450 [Bacillus infantis]
MKKAWILIIGLSLSYLTVFMITEIYTIKRFDIMSGNGNIGLLPAGFLLLLSILLIVPIYQSIPNTIKNSWIAAVFFSVSLLMLISIYIGKSRLGHIRKSLSAHFESSDVSQLTFGMTIYTNAVYINMFSFSTVLLIIVLLTMILKKCTGRRNRYLVPAAKKGH